MDLTESTKNRLAYSRVFKKFGLVKCIANFKETETGLSTISPVEPSEKLTFHITASGWRDNAVSKKGDILDLIADLAKVDRQAPEVFGLALEAGVEPTRKRKLVYSLSELMEMDLPVPQTWLGGFIGAGEATLIVSLPGVGKTWFTLAVAQCLASGTQKLGPWKPAAKKRTLIVDFEMGAMRLRHRLDAIRRGYNLVDTDDDIGILCPELCARQSLSFGDLGQPDQLKVLHEALKDFDCVIIDNVNAAYPNAVDDENGPKFWSQPQNLVMSIRQTGKACIMVHHATKGDPKNPAGSGRNTRFFDNVLALVDETDYTKTDNKKIKVYIKKSRHFPISRENQPEMELRDFQGGTYWALVNDPNIRFEEFTEPRKDLSNNLEDGIPW